MTQNEQILRHLKGSGTITSLEAIRIYGVTRLASRIYDLTKNGHDIRGYMCRVKTRHGAATVKKYFLAR